MAESQSTDMSKPNTVKAESNTQKSSKTITLPTLEPPLVKALGLACMFEQEPPRKSKQGAAPKFAPPICYAMIMVPAIEALHNVVIDRIALYKDDDGSITVSGPHTGQRAWRKAVLHGRPLQVTHVDPETNEVVVESRESKIGANNLADLYARIVDTYCAAVNSGKNIYDGVFHI
jgi:hypothetical protein